MPSAHLLRTIPPDDRVWFTEVGARLDLPGKSEETQASETSYLVDRLGNWSTRIDRIYYYSLCPGVTENTGLFAPPAPLAPTASCMGAPRPAYETYKSRTLLNPYG